VSGSAPPHSSLEQGFINRAARRQVLRKAVLASGALAALGFARDRRWGGERPIARTTEVPVRGAVYFTYPTKDDHDILLQPEPGRFVAFSGRCTNLSCTVSWNPEKGNRHCPCYNTGDAIAGPPSRPLPRIRLRQDADTIYAVEELAG
jgi:Rieske Fe-S protein